MGAAVSLPERPGARLPLGKRVYAIGDIHGRLDLLEELASLIRRDNDVRPAADVYLILLGDLIDRGPDSAAVVERCMAMAQRSPRMVVIKGNHEAMMVAALRGNLLALSAWRRHGGESAMMSWGVPRTTFAWPSSKEMLREVRQHVPGRVLAWLQARPLTLRFGDYLFVHAGIRPGVALEHQNDDDLLAIRDQFIRSEVDHGCVVVHGHSINQQAADVRPNRIGIDTGAYMTGRLTAVGLEENRHWLLTTTGTVSADAGRPVRQTAHSVMADEPFDVEDVRAPVVNAAAGLEQDIMAILGVAEFQPSQPVRVRAAELFARSRGMATKSAMSLARQVQQSSGVVQVWRSHLVAASGMGASSFRRSAAAAVARWTDRARIGSRNIAQVGITARRQCRSLHDVLERQTRKALLTASHLCRLGVVTTGASVSFSMNAARVASSRTHRASVAISQQLARSRAVVARMRGRMAALLPDISATVRQAGLMRYRGWVGADPIDRSTRRRTFQMPLMRLPRRVRPYSPQALFVRARSWFALRCFSARQHVDRSIDRLRQSRLLLGSRSAALASFASVAVVGLALIMFGPSMRPKPDLKRLPNAVATQVASSIPTPRQGSPSHVVHITELAASRLVDEQIGIARNASMPSVEVHEDRREVTALVAIAPSRAIGAHDARRAEPMVPEARTDEATATSPSALPPSLHLPPPSIAPPTQLAMNVSIPSSPVVAGPYSEASSGQSAISRKDDERRRSLDVIRLLRRQ